MWTPHGALKAPGAPAAKQRPYATRVVTWGIIAALRSYRASLGAALPPVCRFEPSCSRYAEQAVRRYGPWRGALRAAWRLLRCQPFSRGGLDPVE